MEQNESKDSHEKFLQACGYEELSEEEKLDLWREFQEDYLKFERETPPRSGSRQSKSSGEDPAGGSRSDDQKNENSSGDG